MTLTIAIPTFNRAPKLRRVLRHFAEQIQRGELESEVTLLVSDNASTDDTPRVIAEFTEQHPKVSFRGHRQPQNVGVVRSMWWLFQNCGTEYFWFFCDDDIPAESAVGTILRVLKAHRPRALLYSFEQPRGCRDRTFDLQESPSLLSEPREIIDAVSRYPKISIYAYRRAAFSDVARAAIDSTISEHGYLHIILALSLLYDDPRGQVAVIPEQLASADDDFQVIRTPVGDWASYHRIFNHPFVVRHAPDLLDAHGPEQEYLAHVSILWSWKVGSLEIDPSFHDEYDGALRQLRFHWPWLIRHPSMLLRAVLLKLPISSAPRLANRTMRSLRQLVPR